MKNASLGTISRALQIITLTLLGAVSASRVLADTTPVGVLAGPIYNPASGHYYYLLETNTWTGSEAQAVALGGHLVSINDANEQNWVHATFSPLTGGNHCLWTGLKGILQAGSTNSTLPEGAYSPSTGGTNSPPPGGTNAPPPGGTNSPDPSPTIVWVWASGEPVTFTHWSSFEPNNYCGNEEYVTLLEPGHSEAGYWNDADNLNTHCGDGTGPFPANGVAEVATISECVPPTVISQPANQTAFIGSTVLLRVLASGTVPIYQWYFNAAPIGSANGPTLTLQNVQTNNAGNYYVLVTNNCGTVTSADATLSVTNGPPPPPPPPPGAVLAGPIYNPASGHYYYLLETNTWTGSEAQAVALGGHLVSINDANEQNWVYATFSPLTGGNHCLWTGLNDANQEGNYVWASGEPVTYSNWDWCEPNNYCGNEDYVTILEPAHWEAGYWNDADNLNTHCGDGTGPFPANGVVEVATISECLPPNVVLQSANQTVFVGNTATFTVAANGTYPLSYQWLLNDTNEIGGATDRELTLVDVQPAQAGNYSVRISNACGTDTSSSATLKVLPTNSATAILTVDIVGNGQVQPAKLVGAELIIGTSYVLTAVPPADKSFLFSNWVSEVNGVVRETSMDRNYKFIMERNLRLTANFVTNMFIKAAGNYYGLFSEDSDVTPQSAGFFKLTANSQQGFSGKLYVEGQAFGFAGRFDIAGRGTSREILRVGRPPLTVTAELGLDGSEEVSGTVNGVEWTAPLAGDKAVATTLAGPYTLVVAAQTYAVQSPAGDGYGLVKVKPNGSVVCNGGLGDGQKLTTVAAGVSRRGDWPVYGRTYLDPVSREYKGLIIGWQQFTNGGGRDLRDGRLIWIKTPTVVDGLYPAGFTNESEVRASAYNVPALGARALGATNVVVVLQDGNLGAAPANPAVLGVDNKFAVLPPNEYALKSLQILGKAGSFKGQFLHPGKPGVATVMQGVVLQDEQVVRGHFPGTNQSGAVRLQSQ